MKNKAMIWAFGVVMTATGLFLGLRGAARAIGIDCGGSYQMSHPLQPDERRVCHSSGSGDAFSPDAYRDELLK